MPPTKMPDGTYVNIAEGTSPEAMAKIVSQYRPKPRTSTFKAPPRPLSEDERDRQSVKDALRRDEGTGAIGAVFGPINTAGRAMARSALFNSDDVLAAGVRAGTTGVVRALQKGDLGQISRTYANTRKARQEYRTEAEDKRPWASGIGGVTGAFMSPIGAGNSVFKGVATGAGRLAALDKTGRATAALAKAAESGASRLALRAANSDVGLAARTGFNQAAAAGFMDTGNVGNATEQGFIGAVLGGVPAAALKGGTVALRTITDRSAGNAPRVAYEKVADMLTRARTPEGSRYTPEAAVAEMKAARAAGSEPMLMDLSPEMRAAGTHISRRPGLDVAGRMVENAEQRAAGAADRFEKRLMDVASPPGDGNAFARKNEVNAARVAQGKIDYAQGGVMDKTIKGSKELRELFKAPTPILRKTMAQAKIMAQNERTPFRIGERGPLTMRGFDYLKRAFDDAISTALGPNGKGKELARTYSQELQRVKDYLSKANPEYGAVLARQRDAFQKIASLEKGQELLSRLAKEPRELLQDLNGPGMQPNEVRMGMVDALLAMRNTADDPVAKLQKYMRSKDQRAVLEKAFGGADRLKTFEDFMRREIRAARTDKMVGGTTAQGHALQLAGDELDDAGKVFGSALRGQAFGGNIGMVSGAVRSIDALRRGLGSHAQEKLGEILSGVGEGLPEGVEAAKREAIRRRALDRARAKRVGKLGGFAASGTAKD